MPAALIDSCPASPPVVLTECPPTALGSPRRNVDRQVRPADASERPSEPFQR
jgi:hypothetical protein